jgi:hypothetical protein
MHLRLCCHNAQCEGASAFSDWKTEKGNVESSANAMSRDGLTSAQIDLIVWLFKEKIELFF